MAEPLVGDHDVTFTLADPHRELAGVRLAHELDLPGQDVDFHYDEQAGLWRLRLPRPPVRRMEYRLSLRRADGGEETGIDPDNPLVAPGAFGDKSVLALPGYTEPAWLPGPSAGETRARATPAWETAAELSIATGVGPVEVTVRSPREPTRHLLFAHDGPEYDRLAALGTFAAAMVADGRVPPFHLVLAAPGPRDERYSANPAYATALASVVLPELHAKLETTGPVVVMGASLGALAALHLQRRYPAVVGGLFLQSGSFFVPRYDECEADYPYYGRVTRYTAAVASAGGTRWRVPVTLTCGVAEENVRNNRLMAQTLCRQGYPVELHELPDAHNYIAWRDAFDPHLTRLLARVWTDA